MSILPTTISFLALAIGGWWISARLLKLPGGAVRFLGAVVVAWTWVTVGMLVLGSFGAITQANLVVWSVGLGVIGGIAGRWGAEPARTDPEARPWEWPSVLALSLVALSVLWRGVPALLFPVQVVSDGPIYHLYFAARWWKSGRLDLIPTPFGENAAPYFPAVGDLWFGWLMTLWGGDRLAKIGQIPFFAVCGAATYRLAREAGIGRDASLIATSWALCSTPFLVFGIEPNVDAIFVGGYATTCLFLVRWIKGLEPLRSLALGAITAGLAWGSKPTGIVFVPPLLVLAGLACLVRKSDRARKPVELLMLTLLPMVGEGFWLVRNAWLTGNPLYPLHLQLAGRVVLQGWYGSDVMRLSQYYLPVSDYRSLSDILLAVLDPRMVPFWVAAVVGGWAIKVGPQIQRRWVWLASGLAVANLAIYWLGIPYRTQQRFMLQAMFLAAIPLAALMDPTKWRRWMGVVILGIHLMTHQDWPFTRLFHVVPWDLSPYVPGGINGWLEAIQSRAAMPTLLIQWAGLIVAARLLLRGRSRKAIWAGAVVIVGVTAGSIGAVVVAAGGLSQLPAYPGFRDYYRAWLDLDQRTRNASFRIAYAGTNLPYYLMGKDFRHHVEYVNVDGHRDWILHDYHRDAIARGDRPTWDHPRPGWDRIHPDYDGWLANLRARGIQLLVVAAANPDEGPFNLADPERFTIERVWADAHPDVFEPLYGQNPPDPLMKIYRVMPANPEKIR